ncbi:MAG: hypothetical protein K8S21_03475 [Gemmatimonadetes bacterium]|nr:hypothetical protein [Gemmatimonadota bacterium]
MSALVNGLRSRRDVIALGTDGPGAITVRVQIPELWDLVTVRCAEGTSSTALKQVVLDAFGERHHPASDYVLKLRGFEVLDESAPVTVAGAREGSTFLMTFRHRRPVR